MGKDMYGLDDLIHIVTMLRSEHGCSWDKEQTHESLIPCLREESEEVVEAIEKNDMIDLEEELGDVLLQVVMHAQIASEKDQFSMKDVIDGIAKKMIRRHPHVFGDITYSSKEEQKRDWERIKVCEKREKLEKKRSFRR